VAGPRQGFERRGAAGRLLVTRGEGFKIGPKRIPDAASHRACRDFRWSGFTLAQRLFQRGDCDIRPNGTAVAKSVGDRLCDAEDRDRDAFDVVRLDLVAEKLIGEANDAQRRVASAPGSTSSGRRTEASSRRRL
jgi:hypothetical protein